MAQNFLWNGGNYQFELEFNTEAPAGLTVGKWRLVFSNGERLGDMEVISGQKTQMDLELTQNLPVSLEYDFNWAADMEIVNIHIRKK